MNNDFEVIFPRDFGASAPGVTAQGEYVEEVMIDGKPWLANVFQVAKPREAEPKILNVKVSSRCSGGQNFYYQRAGAE